MNLFRNKLFINFAVQNTKTTKLYSNRLVDLFAHKKEVLLREIKKSKENPKQFTNSCLNFQVKD